jgi:hypothetical protein
MADAFSPNGRAGEGPPSDDGLGAWIAALRGRLAQGEFDDLAPIDLGRGTASLSAATTVRVLLADLDHHDGLGPARRADAGVAERRRLLLEDFRGLRRQLG